MAISILQLLNLYYLLKVITARYVLARGKQIKVTKDLCKLVSFSDQHSEFSLDLLPVQFSKSCVCIHTYIYSGALHVK